MYSPSAKKVLFGIIVTYVCLLYLCYDRGLWLTDDLGRPVPTDFLHVWAAGKLALEGAPAVAYDWELHRQVETLAIGYESDFYFAWLYPPPFMMVAALLAQIPYIPALLIWLGATLPGYLLSCRAIAQQPSALAALAWPATLWNVALGQSGFLTAALLGGGLLFVERRPVVAGIFFGLLTYKPQFGLLIPIALLAGGHWRVILSATATALALAALSVATLGIEPWYAFLASLHVTNAKILVEGTANFAELQSAFGLVRLLGGTITAAWATQIGLVLSLAVCVFVSWRSPIDMSTKAAILSVATVMASPYAYAYDLVTILIAVLWLARDGLNRSEVVAIVVAGVLVFAAPLGAGPTGLLGATIVLAAALRRYMLPARLSSALTNGTR